MPVKKRMAKKRPVEEIREAWADYFCSGRQMLNGRSNGWERIRRTSRLLGASMGSGFWRRVAGLAAGRYETQEFRGRSKNLERPDMPVRRRISKRAPTARLLELWEQHFEYGWNGFAGEQEELEALVGDVDQAIEAAWHEFGPRFLQNRNDPRKQDRVPWALEKFGEPPSKCLPLRLRHVARA